MTSRTEFKWKGKVVEEGIKFTNEVDGKYYIWKVKGTISSNGFFVVKLNKFVKMFTMEDMGKIPTPRNNYLSLINWGVSSNKKYIILRFKYRKDAYFINVSLNKEENNMKGKIGFIGVRKENLENNDDR